jgi:MGT family glycosyltransferase
VADAANSALDLRQQLVASLGPLRADAGLAPDPDGGMIYRHLHLCFTPARFDGDGAAFPATARFLRHTNPPIPGERLPAWADAMGDRPVVLVSMGTVFHRTPGIYEAIVEGLEHAPVDVVVAAGFDQDPGRLGQQPPHVRIEPYVPLAALLPRCDLFITHGGFNSVKEALSAGVPMVVVPIAADQPYSAQRCAALGVAIALGPDERSPAQIGRAARTVLADPAFRCRAQQMKREMAALPGPDHAVDLLEAIHDETRHGARTAR